MTNFFPSSCNGPATFMSSNVLTKQSSQKHSILIYFKGLLLIIEKIVFLLLWET